MASTEDEDAASNSLREWHHNPETARQRAKLEKLAAYNLDVLKAKAATSTDPEMRTASADYAGVCGAIKLLGGGK